MYEAIDLSVIETQRREDLRRAENQRLAKQVRQARQSARHIRPLVMILTLLGMQ